MSSKRRASSSGRGHVFISLAFILLGFLLTFTNFGLIPWEWWKNSGWKLWPLALIFIGLEIILSRRRD